MLFKIISIWGKSTGHKTVAVAVTPLTALRLPEIYEPILANPL